MPPVCFLLAALALMVAISAFDLLPNGNFNYLVFLFAGALSSASAGIVREERRRARRRKELAARRSDAAALPEAARAGRRSSWPAPVSFPCILRSKGADS